MKIDTLVLGLYENNCYVLRKDERETACLIIDTGLDAEPLIEFLQKNELVPQAVLLTHGHADHTVGLPAVKELWPDLKICVHQDDARMLEDAHLNLSGLAGVEFSTEPADIVLQDGMEIEYAGVKLEVLATPGHTPGGVCYYSSASGVVFVGDTLFAGSVGRTDFPSGSSEQLIQSITSKLLVLPEATRVYPGHGPATTLRNEKKYNPYIREIRD